MKVVRITRAKYKAMFGRDPDPDMVGATLCSADGVPLVNYVFTDPVPDPIKFLTVKEFDDVCRLEKLYELQDRRKISR